MRRLLVYDYYFTGYDAVKLDWIKVTMDDMNGFICEFPQFLDNDDNSLGENCKALGHVEYIGTKT